MNCRNCGASMKRTDAVCPFCGAMNAEGAERKFMGRLYDMKEDLHQSVGATEESIKRSISRSALVMTTGMVLVVLFITIINVVVWKVEAWQERHYEEEQYKTIMWKDEHYEKMDRMYESGDLSGILVHLAGEEVGIWSVSDWEHYQVLESFRICEDISEARREWKEEGYDYLLKSAFVDAFTYAIYEVDVRSEYAAMTGDTDIFEMYVAEMKRFLTEDFRMTEQDLAELLEQAEAEGYAGYSLLSDYAEGKLKAGEE